jgi:hypothetical protein
MTASCCPGVGGTPGRPAVAAESSAPNALTRTNAVGRAPPERRILGFLGRREGAGRRNRVEEVARVVVRNRLVGWLVLHRFAGPALLAGCSLQHEGRLEFGGPAVVVDPADVDVSRTLDSSSLDRVSCTPCFLPQESCQWMLRRALGGHYEHCLCSLLNPMPAECRFILVLLARSVSSTLALSEP